MLKCDEIKSLPREEVQQRIRSVVRKAIIKLLHYAHRSLIFEVHFQELEVYFVKNKGLPMLFLAQCGQMTI